MIYTECTGHLNSTKLLEISKTLPHHDNLKSFGACFGVSGGYERPMWFALDGEKAVYEYSYNYQSWYPSAEYETNNTIKNVGLFDLTSFF